MIKQSREHCDGLGTEGIDGHLVKKIKDLMLEVLDQGEDKK